MSRAGNAARSQAGGAPNRSGSKRGILRTLGRSLSFQGSGAPATGNGVAAHGSQIGSANPRVLAVVAGVVATLAVGVAIASADKQVANFIGASSSGSLGGEFNAPRDVAVNETGAAAGDAGDVYVVDDNNHRIQRFDSEGEFVSAWGADVSQPSGGNDFEVCTDEADCKAGVPSGGNGTVAGNGVLDNPQAIAIDQDTGVVYVSDRDNRRIGAYEGDGSFLFSVGRDVQDPDGDTVVEICGDVAGDVCRQGDGGSGPGEIGATTTSGTQGIAVSPPDGNPATGTLFFADSQNRRVNTYDLDGGNPASFGSSSNFATTQPRKIAVDGRGIVYASDSNNGGEIDRYDTEDANGGGVGFLSSISAPPLLAGSAATATSGLAVDPDSDGGGPDEDVLQVLRDPSSGNTVIQQFGPDNDPGLTAAPTDTDDEHGSGVNFGGVNGLGSNNNTGQLFVATNSTTAAGSGHRVFILDDLTPPEVTIDAIDAGSISDTGVEVSGTVDANDALTSYRFEYRLQGDPDWIQLPDENAGADEDPIEVERTLDGVLEPNATYEVRLHATHTFATGSDTSAAENFTTDPAAPYVALTEADADHGSATLAGRVTANNQATAYHFEWGTDDSYGNSAPASEDGDGGSGGTSKFVSEEITGLAPESTYHFRLVATNATGRTEGSDHVFVTGPAATAGGCPNADMRKGVGAHLPDCRAYEQVSPTDKSGFDAGLTTDTKAPHSGGPASADGNAIAFQSFGAFAGSQWGGSGVLNYLARRDGNGWKTLALQPRPLMARGVIGGGVVGFTPDMSSAILSVDAALTSDTPPSNSTNFYLQDNLTGALNLLAGITATTSGEATSADLEHLAFDTLNILTPEPDQPGTSVRKVYESMAGQLRLVTRQPGNTPFQTSAFLGSNSSIEGAVSDDGSQIFFTTPQTNDGRIIYRRSNGASTAVGSPSRRVPADPAGASGKDFELATADGNRVFFRSPERLTDDAAAGAQIDGGDLYRYDFAADELVDLSSGTTGLTPAEVQGILGISDDGDRVYFAARGQVVPGQGVAGQQNLYLWEDDGTAQGSTRFIATLDPAIDDELLTDDDNWLWNSDKTAQVTSDGGHVVFQSRANLSSVDQAGTSQVYLYDADADDGAGELVCVSCGSGPAAGDSLMAGSTTVSRLSRAYPRWLSEDGRRVFFSSRKALLSRDTNAQYDAYMWQGGELFLLSSGTSPYESYSYGASASGDDAFFRTREQLVPADGDTLLDVYTAHVGGGFASQQKLPASDCQGDGCQDLPVQPPSADRPSSLGETRGNVSPAQRVRLSFGRFSSSQRRKAARSGILGIRLRTSRAGLVRVGARAKLGKRTRRVAGRKVRVRKAGAVTVKLRLNRAAKRRLRSGRALRVTLRVAQSGARTRSATVRLKRGNR